MGEEAYVANKTTEWTAGQKVTIVVYEEIYHAANPMRLAISGSNNEEFDDCIWLNHIPRHARGQLNGGRNMSITLTVPDMTCMNCTLQLLGLHFPETRTNDECCAYNNNETNTCGTTVQYYSCANINIRGGKRDREDVCVQPSDWAYRNLPCNYYKSESSATAWQPEVEGQERSLVLQVSGSVDGFGSAQLDQFCEDSDREQDFGGIGVNTACHRTATDFENLSLLEGGDMQTDGIVAIVVIVVLIVAISATYFIAKKRNASTS